MSDLLPVLVADLANDAARKTLEEVAQAHGEAWVPLLAAPADISPHVLEIYTPDSPEPLRVIAQPLGAPNASGFPLRLHPLAREVAESFHDDDSIRQSTRERVAAPLPIDAEDEETWAFSKAPVAAPPPPSAEVRRDTPTATDLRHQVAARREVPVVVSPKHAEELSGVKELPPDDPRGLVGRALAGGKLVIESLVGGGMMGAVYRAVHRELRMPVAVKVMHESFEKDVDFCRRFYAEALAVSRLDHPNLVRVLDFGQESDGVLYLAMEFLPGRSLRDVVRNEAPLKAPRIAQIMSQVCGALGHAHARGIIHRDVKPDNVLLLPAHDDDGHPIEQVKVCDFGLAIEAKDALRERFAGTPVYMSPEQCRGEELDARSDVYAVGVMLYELGTGTVPFLAETGDEVINLHITAEARPMSDRVRDVDPRLERIVGRALRKAKGERYADMRELRADLKELATTVRFDLAEEAARMPVSEPGGYSVPPPPVPSMPPMPSVSLPPPAPPGGARVDARAETIPRVDTLPRDESFARAETMPRISNVPPPPRAPAEATEAPVPPPRPSTAPAWLEQKDESYAHFLTGMANSATQASEQVADILSREPTKWLAKLVAERDLRTYQKMLAELEIALRLLAKRADARAMWAASNVLHGLATDGSLGPGSRGQRAAMVLRLFADPAMLAPIAERMLARDDDAREAAKTLLTHAGTSGAYALYGARVKLATEPSVRNTFVLAMRALGEKGWPVVRAALERIPDTALVGKHPVAADLAEDLLFSVPAVRDEAAGHVVGKFVRARDPRLCRAATRALGVVWADRAQPIFLGLLSDRDDGIKFAAIAGLRQIGAIDEHVVRRLGQLFASPESSPELRVAIVTAFESATDEGRTLATPFLAQLVRDKAPDDATCLAAARSLQAHVGNEARAVIGDRADRSAEPLRSHLLALIATPTGNLADG